MAELDPHKKMRGIQQSAPNFFLVGAAKAGTTSLWKYISDHPQIYMCQNAKEPHYFLWAEENHQFEYCQWRYIPKPYHTDWNSYLSLFRNAQTSIIGEASVFYLPHPSAPQKIRSRCPDAKIAICLRNPVDRAWSWYRFNRMRHVENAMSFEDAIAREERNSGLFYANQYVALGLYAAQVERYLEVFGRERVHIILFDDLVRDPAGLCRKLFEFLGVDNVSIGGLGRVHNPTADHLPSLDLLFRLRSSNTYWGRIARRAHGLASGNSTYRTTKQLVFDAAEKVTCARKGTGDQQSMFEVTRAFLEDRFSKDVSRLEELIGKDLSHWGCRPGTAAA